MVVTTTVGELLGQNLGYAASLIQQSVKNYNHKKVFDVISGWIKSPIVHQPLSTFDSNSVIMTSSPRFDVYGNEFGFGKAVAVRTGNACKIEGRVSSFPGYEGGGSVDLEICLTSESMRDLELNQEFMNAVSLQPINGVY
ncbi:uncharacterized acetyltransferase At3g50280-like [Amaranthus tricolor]|uniref:uncharacterized acetyltransferase At3g50280-like n=1 Tax=Amaranthus tricolor TaxID=29722 RepID=UPI00258A5C00|nr:uncharacterized acetyltransferase At3g50280-like [Amaranthus tricolor]